MLSPVLPYHIVPQLQRKDNMHIADVGGCSMTSSPATQPAPCSLDRVPSAAGGSIVALQGGRCFVSRLAALGFVPGAPISVVQNYGHGPLIVLVRQARVALGRGEAAHIVVQPETAQ